MVTSAQVTADMVVAAEVPVGHGHRYGHVRESWEAIVPVRPPTPVAGS